MKKPKVEHGMSRRDLLLFSSTGAAILGAESVLPGLAARAAEKHGSWAAPLRLPDKEPYADLLQTWCDGLLSRQMPAMGNHALDGGLLCEACVLIHGRCGDAIYPLLRLAHSTGQSKYLEAALLLYDWSERQVSQSDGSWINDVTLSSWKGITVFRVMALAEAIHHHGSILDAAIRQSWIDRLARAAKFLDSFITIETGNINYPISASCAFALCGQVLGDSHYLDRARKLAHISIEYMTPEGLLFGEGHPLRERSPKGCRPVDLGYNVEESLPSLALYSVLMNDKPVRDATVAAMRTHMEFMLPDGGWDNSWGTRNYKWSWWGSRTSDGCHSAYVLLAEHDPRFYEVARRNLELMAACTSKGLLYGGPDYQVHGDLPCVHHTFTHAKALATVLDRGGAHPGNAERVALPRDEPYGVRELKDIGTSLAAIGDWRGTVTEYDWKYKEGIQTGGGGSGGGHVSGGALSLLYHRQLGPILVSSMTRYQMIEISNQQAFRNPNHMPLTARIECAADRTYTSFSDTHAVLTKDHSSSLIEFDASGRLLSVDDHPMPGDGRYHLIYRLTGDSVEIVASATFSGSAPAPLRFILPVVSRSGEAIDQHDAKTIVIVKRTGRLIIRTNASRGFETVPTERTFNLVPGFECVPVELILQPGQEISIRLMKDKL